MNLHVPHDSDNLFHVVIVYFVSQILTFKYSFCKETQGCEEIFVNADALESDASGISDFYILNIDAVIEGLVK